MTGWPTIAFGARSANLPDSTYSIITVSELREPIGGEIRVEQFWAHTQAEAEGIRNNDMRPRPKANLQSGEEARRIYGHVAQNSFAQFGVQKEAMRP